MPKIRTIDYAIVAGVPLTPKETLHIANIYTHDLHL